MSPDRPESPDALTRLPAERRQPKDNGVVLYACCCCCCCCCLHTIGGMIGVAMSGNYRGATPRDPEEDSNGYYDDDDEFAPPSQSDYDRPRRQLPGVQGIFWTSLLIVILLQIVIGGIVGLVNNASMEVMLWFTPCALIMLGPLYFFAACVVLALRIAANPALRRDGGYYRAALKLFGWTFAGSLAGMLIMALPLILLAVVR